MATCPKCGVKLKVTDWKPNCPNCGINLVYYGMEDRLLEDADKAESEHALFQKKFDRLKASFVGSKLTIARIVLSVLPVIPFLLPLAKVSFSGPFFEVNTSVNAITLYNVISSLDFNGLLTYIGSDMFGSAFILYAVSIVTLLLTLVFLVVDLVMLVLACSPHGNVRNITLNCITLALPIISIVTFTLFCSKLHAVFPSIFTGSVSWGAYVLVAAIAALLTINIVIAKVGVKVKYKQTYVGGIPSEDYFAYIEQGMSTREIRGMMAEIDAKAKAEAALKAKEEADAAEEAAQELAAQAKLAEERGDDDAGEKTQNAAKALDEAAKKALDAAKLAQDASRALASLEQYKNETAREEEPANV